MANNWIADTDTTKLKQSIGRSEARRPSLYFSRLAQFLPVNTAVGDSQNKYFERLVASCSQGLNRMLTYDNTAIGRTRTRSDNDANNNDTYYYYYKNNS